MPEEKFDLEIKRHSLSHVLAMAVLDMFPEAKLGIGPAIENGFYYDFDLPRTLIPEDLPILEAKMKDIIKAGYTFDKSMKPKNQAIKFLEEANQQYKVELAKEFADDELTFYKTNGFVDLCAGPHISSTKDLEGMGWKLDKIAGAYWRGSEKNVMLQRIYGLAFETKEELKKYEEMQEEAKKRDHRILGPQLGIFMHSDVVGTGLPLFLPKGETLKHILQEYMRKKEEKLGYKYVGTPVITHEELYKRSGHAQFYADDMYKFQDKEGATFYIAPMNCPHHHMIYERLVQSYRDLPLKLAEGKGLYRNELSGTLTGLIRVRGPISQNDSHIYVTPSQLKEEFVKVLALFKEVYDEMKIEGYWFRLSLPNNSSKYGGDREMWENASASIREALQEFGSPFVEAPGEAAFYGPKLDVQIKNVTGKEDSIATAQVDILVPGRMGLKYIDENGQTQVPIVIHRSILGSYERFIGFLIEQTAGALPVWLAPIQVVVMPIADRHIEYTKKVHEELLEKGIRSTLDDRTETIGRKIREAEMQKIPFMLIIGDKEIEVKKVAVREYGKGDKGQMKIPELISEIK